MALLYGAKFLQQQAGPNLPHVFGFGTVRSVGDDTLLEVWNGATDAARVNAIDKDGKLYSAAATVGDVLYAVTGGVTSVRRFDSLAIGTNGQVLTVNSGATAPQWSSTLTLGDGAVGAPTYSFASATNTGVWLDGTSRLLFSHNGIEFVRLDRPGGNPQFRFYGTASQNHNYYYDQNPAFAQWLTRWNQYGNDGTTNEVLGGYMEFAGGESAGWADGAHGTRWALRLCLAGGITPQTALAVTPTSTEMRVSLNQFATLYVGTKQILTARKGGWGQPTGSAIRSTFATSTVTLEELAQRVKALIDDLNIDSSGHGLIGAT
jgi:hypothetical protein